MPNAPAILTGEAKPWYTLLAKRWSTIVLLDEALPLPRYDSDLAAQEGAYKLLRLDPEVWINGEKARLTKALDGWAVFPVCRSRVVLVGQPLSLRAGEAR